MKKRWIAALLLTIFLMLPVSASGTADPADVFLQERELLASGTPAEKLVQGRGVYILEVAEVSPPEAQFFHQMTPFDGKDPQEITEIWDYSLTTVRCHIVGSETGDYVLCFGRDFVSRSGGKKAVCPDDGFPDPLPGDRLLLFDQASQRNGGSVSPPLWESHADQINSIVVVDGECHVTVCLSGTPMTRGSDAIPID